MVFGVDAVFRPPLHLKLPDHWGFACEQARFDRRRRRLDQPFQDRRRRRHRRHAHGDNQIAKKKEKVLLVGFGTFQVSKRKAGEGRNPQTGEKIKIAAANVPRFKASKQLKEAIN